MPHTFRITLFFAAIGSFAIATLNPPIKVNFLALGLLLWSCGRYSDVATH